MPPIIGTIRTEFAIDRESATNLGISLGAAITLGIVIGVLVGAFLSENLTR